MPELLHQRYNLAEHFQAGHTAATARKIDRVSAELDTLGDDLRASGKVSGISQILHIGVRRIDQAGNVSYGIVAASNYVDCGWVKRRIGIGLPNRNTSIPSGQGCAKGESGIVA